jgi:anti-sigma factor (TIGR02949 family)
VSAPPRGIDCRQAVERLYEFLDQELTAELRVEVEYHLKVCAGCFRHFEFERVFLQFLEARARARGATPELKHKILHELFGPGAS